MRFLFYLYFNIYLRAFAAFMQTPRITKELINLIIFKYAYVSYVKYNINKIITVSLELRQLLITLASYDYDFRLMRILPLEMPK